MSYRRDFSSFYRVVNRHFCSRRQDVRVRFAPSPTGQLHLGSLRTALYNYLFARKHGGSFILRIEDTDQTRIVPGSVQNIHRILDHYHLNCDEGPIAGGSHGPYEQSKRLPLYKEKVEQLIESGHAYRCFCSEDRLALLRKEANRQNAIPKYDRKCRSLNPADSRRRAESEEQHVVRFQLDKQNVSFEDSVFGSVTQCIDESDMVLLKSDGFPTYHLANVVDDKAMEISHVIRGMEWLSSTGKHEILYKSFGWKSPKWVHLSLITRDGKKKLSKRDKDAYVDYYDKELGALPDAVLNLLVRNGSGVDNFDLSRLYTLEELVQNFDHTLIGRRNLQLDTECLERYSRMSFQAADFDTVLYPVISEMIKSDIPNASRGISKEYLLKVVNFLKSNEERFSFLSSLTRGDFKWFLTLPTSADKLLIKFTSQEAKQILDSLLSAGRGVWSLDRMNEVSSNLNIPRTQLLLVVRLSLIDSPSGPPVAELFSFFGAEECEKRIKQMRTLLTVSEMQKGICNAL